MCKMHPQRWICFSKGFRATFRTAVGSVLYIGTQFLRKNEEIWCKKILKCVCNLRLMLNLGRCPAPVLISPQVPPELLHFIGFNFPGKHIPVYQQIFASSGLKLGLVPIFVCEPSQTFNNHWKKTNQGQTWRVLLLIRRCSPQNQQSGYWWLVR